MSLFHCFADSSPASTPQRTARTLDRRVLLKATAAFLGMATTSRHIGSSASSQSFSTRAGEWHQPANVGGEAHYLAFEADFAFKRRRRSLAGRHAVSRFN
jgi:hypothetical protein